MNRLIFGYDQDIADWVAARVPRPFDPKNLGPFTTIGVMHPSEDRALAGFIYSRFKGHDVEITGAAVSPLWAQRGVFHALLSYPFEQLGCVRVTMITGKKNRRARRLIKFLGFTEEGTHALAYDGKDDACSYGLRRDVWLASKFGPLGMRAAPLISKDDA